MTSTTDPSQADMVYTLQVYQLRGCTVPLFRSTQLLRVWLAGLAVGLAGQLLAAEITERLPNGIHVSADYLHGQPALPSVLVLHGFLQTRSNATVSNLVNSLASEGYTVLAPTLSLGVSRRKQSLACETPHTHTFDNDVGEIAFWVRWLEKRGATSVVLVGHSSGSVQLLASIQLHSKGIIRKLVAVSLVEYAHEFGGKQNLKQYQQARSKQQKGDVSLGRYKLSYCNNYVAPARAFLSYAQWDGDKLVALLRASSVPVTVIAGDADERMGAGWLESLKAVPVEVRTVKGANHFFSDAQEFDLHDQVNLAIKE